MPRTLAEFSQKDILDLSRMLFDLNAIFNLKQINITHLTDTDYITIEYRNVAADKTVSINPYLSIEINGNPNAEPITNDFVVGVVGADDNTNNIIKLDIVRYLRKNGFTRA